MEIMEPNLIPPGSGETLLPQAINEIIQRIFTPADLEVHPFLVEWYNELVGSKFALNFPDNTVALTVISGPEVFEKCVVPYLQSQKDRNQTYSTMDPLDETMKFMFHLFSKELEAEGFPNEVYHDFELHPNRRPKVLVQTAAHVSGAAEYFIQDRLAPSENNSKKKLFGVAIHPKHGGWFAIRGVVILKGCRRNLKPFAPLNLLCDETIMSFLLEEFSFNWKQNLWRDVYPPRNGIKYSKDFLEYLETEPDHRWAFIQQKGYLKKMPHS